MSESGRATLPDSRFEIVDCGTPLRSASCTCVSPAWLRHARSCSPSIDHTANLPFRHAQHIA